MATNPLEFEGVTMRIVVHFSKYSLRQLHHLVACLQHTRQASAERHAQMWRVFLLKRDIQSLLKRFNLTF